MRHELVQHDRHRLGGFWRQQYLRAFDTCAALSCAGRKLLANEIGKAHAVPVAAAEQPVSICHRLNAAIKYLQELVHRAAVLPGAPRNGGDVSEHVLNAVVELTDEHALAFFRALSLGDVPGQSLETQIPTGCAECRLTRLLEPDLTPVRANEAKKRRIGRALNAKAPDPCSEACAILRMYTCEEIVVPTMGGPVRFETEDLGSIFAALRQAGSVLPCESHHLTGGKRLLHPRATLPNRPTPLPAFIDLARDLGDEGG